ncbi:hypothetical protein [Burkholderia anthina]|uniref:hypothetical protein n=1 Tax=Burkholderia anthina TaxID=179879 RepID=UPI00158EC8EB|nr:hypothetical protein [Burkholderia anthina]
MKFSLPGERSQRARDSGDPAGDLFHERNLNRICRFSLHQVNRILSLECES